MAAPRIGSTATSGNTSATAPTGTAKGRPQVDTQSRSPGEWSRAGVEKRSGWPRPGAPTPPLVASRGLGNVVDDATLAASSLTGRAPGLGIAAPAAFRSLPCPPLTSGVNAEARLARPSDCAPTRAEVVVPILRWGEPGCRHPVGGALPQAGLRRRTGGGDSHPGPANRAGAADTSGAGRDDPEEDHRTASRTPDLACPSGSSRDRHRLPAPAGTHSSLKNICHRAAVGCACGPRDDDPRLGQRSNAWPARRPGRPTSPLHVEQLVG